VNPGLSVRMSRIPAKGFAHTCAYLISGIWKSGMHIPCRTQTSSTMLGREFSAAADLGDVVSELTIITLPRYTGTFFFFFFFFSGTVRRAPARPYYDKTQRMPHA
jgi:hypothetical protein